MKRRKSAYIKSRYQMELEFPVTTMHVLCIARKLEGHHWTTSDMATALVAQEYKVRSAVSWLHRKRMVKVSGKEIRTLPRARRPGNKLGNYKAKTYTITEFGMENEVAKSHRDNCTCKYGDVAALEMALGFCRAFIYQ